MKGLSWSDLISSHIRVLGLMAAEVAVGFSAGELAEIESKEGESLSGGCHALWPPD